MENKPVREVSFIDFVVAIAGLVLCVVGCKNNNIPMTIFGAALIVA